MSYDDDDYDDDTTSTTRSTTSTPSPARATSATPRRCCAASIDIIATAPTMPLSSSPRIDRDEIIELLEEALQRLPDELRQARWMLKERQEFVAKTRREADELLEAARVRAERMVQRTEVVRAAEQRARQVMETAEADARRLRHETEDFLDQRLGSFEILLDKLQKTVGAGRQRLSIGAVRRRHRRRRGGRPHQGVLRPGPVSRRRCDPRAVAAGQRRRAAAPAGHAPRTSRSPSPLADARRRRPAPRAATSPSTSTLESTLDDIVVTGTLDVPWRGRVPALPAAARRARSRSTSTSATPSVRPAAGPTTAFPIEHGQIDLAPMVREEVLLAVADAPLCRPDCAGLCPICGADRNDGPCGCDTRRRDERWAALDQLRVATDPSDAGRRRSARSAARAESGDRRAAASLRQPVSSPTGDHDGRSQEEEVEVEDPQPPRRRLEARRPVAQRVPALRHRQAAAHGLPDVRLVQGPRRRRRRLIVEPARPSMLPDRRRRHGRRPGPGRDRRRRAPRPPTTASPSSSSARADLPTRRRRPAADRGVSEVIAMDEDPAQAVRRKKDSSLVRAAEAVRDGKASAMISAGNTGATMAVGAAADGPHQGRQPPGDRHADPGPRRRRPTVLLDAGANAEVQPEWLVQFAQMGAVYARTASASPQPRVGLLSIGEEPGKGDSLRKEAYELLARRRRRSTSSATSRAAT